MISTVRIKATLKTSFIISLLFLLASTGLDAAQSLQYQGIEDDGSLSLSDERKVRLIGTLCPVFGQEKRNLQIAREFSVPAWRFGQYATKLPYILDELMRGQVIETQTDPVFQTVQHHDERMRFLAYVFLPGKEMVNEMLIREGYCAVDTRFPFRYQSRFLELQEEAMVEERGIWKGG